MLVKFKPGVGAEEKQRLHEQMGAVETRSIPSLGVQVMRVPAAEVGETVIAYKQNPQVEYAEPNYVATAFTDPNDPYYGLQRALNNTGQSGGTVDADIDAPEAWNIHTGSANIIIAVIDTGIDPTHPDLSSKIMAGYDFVDNDNDPRDSHGHGTHVAGIAAATSNNGVGIAGVSWGSKIMPLRALNDYGSGSYAWVANAITYAADHGARVINMSWGVLALRPRCKPRWTTPGTGL